MTAAEMKTPIFTAADVKALLESIPPKETRYFLWFPTESAYASAEKELLEYVDDWDVMDCDPERGVLIVIDVLVDAGEFDVLSCALHDISERRGGRVDEIYDVENDKTIWDADEDEEAA